MTASPIRLCAGSRLIDSYDRLRDFEAIGMTFPRNPDGSYMRRPTRGLDLARVMHPDGGGLEFCWHLRRALENEGVKLIDRLFITGLLRDADGRVVGASGVNSRTGEFRVIAAKATIVATNAITFRSGFVRDITGTGTLLAYAAGATLRNAEFSYVRPGHAEILFRGHHLRHSGRRALDQRQGRGLHARLFARLGRRGRRAEHRPRHGDGEQEGQRAALSRHVANPGSICATTSSRAK